MSETIKVEMEMPKPPEGWRHKRFGRPMPGEYYMWLSYGRHAPDKWEVSKSGGDEVSAYPILERAPWKPKQWDMVFCHTAAGKIYEMPFGLATSDLEVFRTMDAAERYNRETHALADRIRAESEAEK